MELRQLRHFMAVAESRSFTAAANRLNMSQPALSQSIARLEQDLDCTLFQRNKQNPGVGMLLTPAGEALYGDGAGLLVAAQRTEERTRRAGHSLSRIPVAIGFSSSTPQSLVSAALGGADASHVDVIPVQLEWGHEHDAIVTGLVDLAFLQYPAGAEFPGHEVSQITRVPRIAIVARAHTLADRSSVQLIDLAREPILDPGFADGPAGFRDLWLGSPRPPEAPLGPIVGPPARTVEEMCNFVSAGRGMAIASQVVADRYRRSDLAFLPIVDLPPVEVGIARLREDDRSTVRLLFDAIASLSSDEKAG